MTKEPEPAAAPVSPAVAAAAAPVEKENSPQPEKGKRRLFAVKRATSGHDSPRDVLRVVCPLCVRRCAVRSCIGVCRATVRPLWPAGHAAPSPRPPQCLARARCSVCLCEEACWRCECALASSTHAGLGGGGGEGFVSEMDDDLFSETPNETSCLGSKVQRVKTNSRFALSVSERWLAQRGVETPTNESTSVSQ
jgi:hypothetical protein